MSRDPQLIRSGCLASITYTCAHTMWRSNRLKLYVQEGGRVAHLPLSRKTAPVKDSTMSASTCKIVWHCFDAKIHLYCPPCAVSSWRAAAGTAGCHLLWSFQPAGCAELAIVAAAAHLLPNNAQSAKTERKRNKEIYLGGAAAGAAEGGVCGRLIICYQTMSTVQIDLKISDDLGGAAAGAAKGGVRGPGEGRPPGRLPPAARAGCARCKSNRQGVV